MPAVLNIGCHHYFFTATANAAKVADLLNKATLVDRQFGRGHEPDTYTLPRKNEYIPSIELQMTKQSKPKSAQLALPEPK
jgi:hypothetical protein